MGGAFWVMPSLALLVLVGGVALLMSGLRRQSHAHDWASTDMKIFPLRRLHKVVPPKQLQPLSLWERVEVTNTNDNAGTIT